MIAMSHAVEIANAEYHSLPGVSNSRLKVFMDDVREYWYQFLSGLYVPEIKTHFDIGTVVHDLVLLRDDSRVVCIPQEVLSKSGSKSGKAWDQFAEENEGLILLKQQEHATVMRCCEALASHPVASALLDKPGLSERMFRYQDSSLEMSLRCKPDKIIDNGVVVDIKTTSTGTRASRFVKNITSYGYHYQEYFYRKVLAKCGVNVAAFVFVAVQVEPPYTVDCYTISDSFRRIAEVDVENSLLELAERTRANNWLPNNHNSIVELEPPNYLNYKGEYAV